MPPLKNNRRERFCLELVSGCSQSEAARRAGYKAYKNGITVVRLMKNREIAARIGELQQLAISDRMMTIIRRKERLSEIGESLTARDSDVIRAIAELNKMDGAYAPTRVETKSEQIQIKAIEYFDGDDDKPMRVIENR